MAWTYADYESYEDTDGPAEALRRARLFAGELRAAIQADVGKDGQSRNSGSLNQLLAQTTKDIARLRRTAGTMVTYVRRSRA